jgi:polysaccharide export outer membrane protein
MAPRKHTQEKRMKKLAVMTGLLLALMTTLVWAQDNMNGKDKKPNAPMGGAKDAGAVAGPDYIIGPDDVLHVSVWKETDLTSTLPVRPDGKISMPLLDDVQAAGLTPMQLANSLTEKLKKFMADPRVTVVVTAMNSQKVYILGEVTHTGAMALTPNMTVLQAIASAGFTQFANTKGIYVLRTENGKQQKLPFNYKQVVKGEAMDQNVLLRPGDTIVVP